MVSTDRNEKSHPKAAFFVLILMLLEIVVKSKTRGCGLEIEGESTMLVIHFVVAEETDRKCGSPMLCGHPSDDRSETNSVTFSIHEAKLTHCIQSDTELFNACYRVTDIRCQH